MFGSTGENDWFMFCTGVSAERARCAAGGKMECRLFLAKVDWTKKPRPDGAAGPSCCSPIAANYLSTIFQLPLSTTRLHAAKAEWCEDYEDKAKRTMKTMSQRKKLHLTEDHWIKVTVRFIGVYSCYSLLPGDLS